LKIPHLNRIHFGTDFVGHDPIGKIAHLSRTLLGPAFSEHGPIGFKGCENLLLRNRLGFEGCENLLSSNRFEGLEIADMTQFEKCPT
jgi:hypothetical protein